MFLKIYFSGNQKPGKFPPPPHSIEFYCGIYRKTVRIFSWDYLRCAPG